MRGRSACILGRWGAAVVIEGAASVIEDASVVIEHASSVTGDASSVIEHASSVTGGTNRDRSNTTIGPVPFYGLARAGGGAPRLRPANENG